DGAAFQKVFSEDTDRFPFGVFGQGAGLGTDVWLYGAAGRLVRFHGGALGAVASGTTATLRRVWGSTPDDLWAGGDEGALLHWNGSYWVPVTSGQRVHLEGIGGQGTDLLAVGQL